MADPYFDKFLIYRGEHWDVFISERGGNNLGRLYFWLHRDGIVDYDDLTSDERAELLTLHKAFKQALRELFKFDGPLNFAYLANEEKHSHHCHYHLVPRYRSPRSFGGVTFNDIAWGHPWKSAIMHEELAIAVGLAVIEKAAPLLVA